MLLHTLKRKCILVATVLLATLAISIPSFAETLDNFESNKAITFYGEHDEEEVPDPRPQVRPEAKPNLPQTGQTTFHVLPIVGGVVMTGALAGFVYQITKVARNH